MLVVTKILEDLNHFLLRVTALRAPQYLLNQANVHGHWGCLVTMCVMQYSSPFCWSSFFMSGSRAFIFLRLSHVYLGNIAFKYCWLACKGNSFRNYFLALWPQKVNQNVTFIRDRIFNTSVLSFYLWDMHVHFLFISRTIIVQIGKVLKATLLGWIVPQYTLSHWAKSPCHQSFFS